MTNASKEVSSHQSLQIDSSTDLDSFIVLDLHNHLGVSKITSTGLSPRERKSNVVFAQLLAAM